MKISRVVIVKTYYDVDYDLWEPLTHERIKNMFMKDKLYNPNFEYCIVDRQNEFATDVCRILKHPLSD